MTFHRTKDEVSKMNGIESIDYFKHNLHLSIEDAVISPICDLRLQLNFLEVIILWFIFISESLKRYVQKLGSPTALNIIYLIYSQVDFQHIIFCIHSLFLLSVSLFLNETFTHQWLMFYFVYLVGWIIRWRDQQFLQPESKSFFKWGSIWWSNVFMWLWLQGMHEGPCKFLEW